MKTKKIKKKEIFNNSQFKWINGTRTKMIRL